jgi:group II intron reverse transcriptase/maturase
MDVDEMQKKLAVWAESDPDHRFFDIYHLLYDEDWLHRAYRAVKANAGSRTAGVDGLNMSDFEEDKERNLQDLRQSLKSETFEPKPVRRTYIPKGDGRKRPLGIPTIKDRIVQEALRMVLEPIYETDFSQYSYGFRPNRNTMDALEFVRMMTDETHKYFWVIDADIEGFFDNVDHQTLEQIVQDRIKDQQIRDLIWEFLKAGVMEEGEYRHSMLGTPQGGIVSPLLANVYLNELDQWAKRWTDIPRREKKCRRREGKGNWVYTWYADDFLMLSNGSKGEVEQMKGRLRSFLEEKLSLTLSKKKTELVHVNDGFDFLGFHVERSVNGMGKKQTQITIPKEAERDLREKIYAATSDTQFNVSVRAKIMALNPVIRGWAEYYKYCWKAQSVYNRLDSFIWRQMMKWIAGKHDTSVKEAVGMIGPNKSRIKYGDMELTCLKDTDGGTKYMEPIHKDHPYLEDEVINREEFPEERPWLGDEGDRAGLKDQRMKVLKRDDWTCQSCGANLSEAQPEVHHKKPVRDFSNPKEANRLENLVSLCPGCHKDKTDYGKW